jgi:4-aminobutyrate aminotransferase-like enzyme
MEFTARKNSTIVDELGEYLVPNSNTSPVIVAGRGAEVEDDEGRRYVDLEGGPGVVSVGHCHPRVVDAVRQQAGRLMQSPGRNHSAITLTLARRIVDALNSDIRRVFFANSGAEAADGAIKVALKHALASGKQGFGLLAFEHGFHGRLSLPLSLTGMAARKKGFGPYTSFPGVVHVPTPYCYRCPFGKEPSSCGLRCADAVEDALKTRVPGEAAVFLAEPILGVGGIIVPPDGYWERVRAICARHKILLAHDEVFTGFGRTGRMFAHQHWGTKPDLVTFAKAIGGGLPLGGFATTDAVVSPLEDGDHFTTFGGNNQVGIAAAHAVLDVLRDEALPQRAGAVGERWIEALKTLARRYDFVGDVRGRGLMIGIELVEDRKSKQPAANLAKAVQQGLRDRGVLVSITGVHGCVLRITPPLVIEDSQIDRSLDALEATFAAVRRGRPS